MFKTIDTLTDLCYTIKYSIKKGENMDLGDISNIYKENLNSFFRNEEVIDLIYTEQFGSDNYNNETKKDYLEKYNSILDNTLFIPYITLDDLDNMLIQQRELYGDNYIKENLGKELNLSKKLHAEKKEIIKRYSSFMLDDLQQLFPKMAMDESSRLLKNCLNNSLEENANFIKDELLKDKNKLFIRFKKNKVEKIIEKYKKFSDEKILMETSSFYKHLSDIPDGKYSTDILQIISEGGQDAIRIITNQTNMNEDTDKDKDINKDINIDIDIDIDTDTDKNKNKNKDKNIRYVFLPVFKYHDETEYLMHALHEFMHISKELILNNKYYQSGFLINKLSKKINDSRAVSLRTNRFLDVWQNFKWSRKAKRNGLTHREKKYNSNQRSKFCRRSN